MHGGRLRQWGGLQRCPHVETTTRQSRAAIAAIIDTAEGRGAANAELRRLYLDVEQQALAAGANGDVDTVHQLEIELNRIGEQFVRYNMGLAGVLVNKYSDAAIGDDADAYMLACMEAFWLAFTTWDPEQSTFGTWSRKAIEGALWREVRFHKRPHRKYYEELIYRAANNHADSLRELLGREPEDEEIARAAGITVEQLHDVRRPATLSLDKPYDDTGHTLAEMLSGDGGDDDTWGEDTSGGLAVLNALAANSSEEDVWIRALSLACADLDDLSLYLIFVRTGLHGWQPENLPEIAAATGIGREIVRRKTHKAFATVQAAGKRLPALL